MTADETQKTCVEHHIHMALYIVPLSGILLGVLVLGLILSVVTHKGNSRRSPLQRGLGIPQTDHMSAPQTDRAVKKRRPRLLIKNTTSSSTDYTVVGELHGEDALATSTAERCRRT